MDNVESMQQRELVVAQTSLSFLSSFRSGEIFCFMLFFILFFPFSLAFFRMREVEIGNC